MYPGEKVLYAEWDREDSYDYGMEFLEDKNGKRIFRLWSEGCNAFEIELEKLSMILDKIKEDK